jgi:hypothetical protein
VPQSKSISPLRDWHILQTARGPLVVLWAIREKGPLTLTRLFQLTCMGDQDAALTGNFAGQAKALVDALRILINSKMIQVTGDLDEVESKGEQGSIIGLMSAGNKVTLQIALSVGLLQQLFGLSLTDYAAGKGDHMSIEPIFGHPTPGNWPEIFVVMPFLETLRPVYDDVILPTARSLGLSCKRGDDFFSDESIVSEIWGAIFYSKLCVVECTGRNPNVFYEIGIAHTLGRPCIVIAQSADDIPFDVTNRFTFVYENTPQGYRTLRENLSKALQVELGIERNKLKDILDMLN